MGCYVNPPVDKMAWLEDNGMEVTRNEALEHNDYKDLFLVVTMDNGPFVAAGVAIDPSEKRVFMNIDGDLRPRRYFIVEASVLMPVSDLEHYRRR